VDIWSPVAEGSDSVAACMAAYFFCGEWPGKQIIAHSVAEANPRAGLRSTGNLSRDLPRVGRPVSIDAFSQHSQSLQAANLLRQPIACGRFEPAVT
jgi:hypothetical protein